MSEHPKTAEELRAWADVFRDNIHSAYHWKLVDEAVAIARRLAETLAEKAEVERERDVSKYEASRWQDVAKNKYSIDDLREYKDQADAAEAEAKRLREALVKNRNQMLEMVRLNKLDPQVMHPFLDRTRAALSGEADPREAVVADEYDYTRDPANWPENIR